MRPVVRAAQISAFRSLLRYPKFQDTCDEQVRARSSPLQTERSLFVRAAAGIMAEGSSSNKLRV